MDGWVVVVVAAAAAAAGGRLTDDGDISQVKIREFF